MGTIADKLTYLAGTKQAIKDKINELGGGMPDTTPFRLYPDYITGGSTPPTPPAASGSARAQFIWVDAETGHTRIEFVYPDSSGAVHYPDGWYEGDIAAKTAAESGDWETPALTYAETLYTYGGKFVSKAEAEAAMGSLGSDLTISTKHLYTGATAYLCVYLNTDLTVTVCDNSSYVTQVDWGDGTVGSDKTHTYAAPGAYTIKATNSNGVWSNLVTASSSTNATSFKLRRLYISNPSNNSTRYNRGMVDAFTGGTFYNNIFQYCGSLVNVSPILGGVVTQAFYYCHSFNQPVTIPDGITNTSSMFYYCYSFNQPVTIPAGVTNTASMFCNCYAFNRPVTIPDSVTTTASMFGSCRSLNQPIGLPQSATTLQSMFADCYAFNQPLVIPTGVTNVQGLLSNCYAYNQPLVVPASVSNTTQMLYNSTGFQADLTLLKAPANYSNELYYMGWGLRSIRVPAENLAAWQVAWPDWAGLFEGVT
jgi:hypothetical protein